MTLLTIGLIAALLGAPLTLLAFRQLGFPPMAIASRLALWLLGILVMAIAVLGAGNSYADLGLRIPDGESIFGAGVATAVVLGLWPLFQRLQRSFGGDSIDRSDTLRVITSLSVSARLFIVLTAAVVEETLYRGYAIGIGEHLLGGSWPAVALSLAAFVLGHFRWGMSHLLSVFWAGSVLSVLFVGTHDLAACVLAHAAIDSVGLFLAPVAIARRQAARSAAASEK